MHDPELKVGERVIISRDDYSRINDSNQGEVVKFEQSDDLSYHGSPMYVWIYSVKGDDGKTYQGTYWSDQLTDGGRSYYFIRPEDISRKRGFRLSTDKVSEEIEAKDWTVDDLISYLKDVSRSGRGNYKIPMMHHSKVNLVDDSTKEVFI